MSADRDQLRQVLQNLIENALKFSAEGTTPEIHVGAAESEAAWTLSVGDNGIGIDPAYHDQLFVPFKRLHAHDAYAGTGIGLAMCQKIAERHGGQMWVESQLNEGTTFYLSLPKEANHEQLHDE